jgi:EAL domain-containing protein (putative c-di-GMP-specific phosphodiesterase class I)
MRTGLRTRKRPAWLSGIFTSPLANAPHKVMREAPRRSATPPPELTAEDLDDALNNRLIGVHYLPVVDLETRQQVGVEALARWHHPRFGLLPPAQFVPLAERSGLILSLTLHVARRAMRQVALWQRGGLPLQLGINLSMAGIMDLDLPELLTQSAEVAGLSPQSVTLEMSERALGHSAVVAFGVLSELRAAGFRLAVDDYGTGSVDIEILRRLDFSDIKIDRSLITDLSQDPERQSVVQSIISLGHRLGMQVIAEGVASREDWGVLIEARCQAAQGELISPPVPADEIPMWRELWLDRNVRSLNRNPESA